MGSSPPAKCKQVEQQVTAVAMPWQLTEVVMGGVSADTEESTKEVLVSEYMVHEVWHGSRECLEMSQRQWRIRAAALQGSLSGELAAHVKRMMEGEWEKFEQWKMWFLEETTSFKGSMEVGAFGLDEWNG